GAGGADRELEQEGALAREVLHSVVEAVDDVDRVVGRDGEVDRRMEFAVAAAGVPPTADVGAGAVVHDDAVVAGIGDEHRSIRVDAEAAWDMQLGRAVAVRPELADEDRRRFRSGGARGERQEPRSAGQPGAALHERFPVSNATSTGARYPENKRRGV